MSKTKSLATMKINGSDYSIRATEHALLRMKQRDVDEYVISGSILSLGKEKLLDYQDRSADVMIIDEIRKISTVFGFKGNKIQIVTVIDKDDIWIKTNTEIARIGD